MKRAIVLVALLLAGCGGQAAPPAPSASAPVSASAAASGLPHLTMSYSQAAGDQMTTWLAKEGGIYQQNGLDVDLRLTESTTGMSALLGGEVQISSIGGSEAMGAAAGGADVEIVANLAPAYNFKFMVAPSIKSKEDLVGKKLGVTRPGSTTDTGLRAMLVKIGLQPDKDVTIVPLGANKTATAGALFNGTVHGSLMQPPDNLEAEDKGFVALYDLSKMDIPSAGATIVVQRTWASAHRELVQKFVDSIVQAAVREKKDRALGEAVVRKYYKTDDERTVKYAYEYHSGTHPLLPYPKIEQFATAIASIKVQNANAANFDFAGVLDPSFVKSADDRGLAAA